MRIISGKYRGKKLKEFDLYSTRPTLDRVKEAMFNLVQFDVVDSVVCDLFSGTGALGIECISRGAKKVYMVDNNPNAIKIIKENLNGIAGDYVVKNQDFMTFLKGTREKFDLVLLDPPFKSDFGVEAIDYILKNDLLSDKGIILFETGDDRNFDFTYSEISLTRRKYGTVAVYKLEKM